jgi:hypothetical protein
MNQIDDIAHIIQLSVAPVFLLAGIGAFLTVLSGRLSRIVDRARVLEAQLVTPERPHSATIVNELNVLEKRGRLIFHAMHRGGAPGVLRLDAAPEYRSAKETTRLQ